MGTFGAEKKVRSVFVPPCRHTADREEKKMDRGLASLEMKCQEGQLACRRGGSENRDARESR